jgi:TetR/AcrR family transcriptional regulator, regulator of cefoperazone and chloramphenicol sensitivity
MATGHDPKDDTRERLLDAAERLFCQKGFETTSVRDLTSLAGCNVASVNYYFGGKEQLYLQMFRRQMKKVIDAHIERIAAVMSGPSPTLQDLVRSLVSPPLKAMQQNEPRWAVMQLMTREVLNRHIDPELIMRDLKMGFAEYFSQALRAVEPGLDAFVARLAACSVEASVFHPLMFMQYYLNWIEGLDIDRLVDHIVQFNVAAIRGLAASSQSDRSTPGATS